MNDLHAPSVHEKRWIGAGLVFGGSIIALATYHAADHVSAFVSALGAVGQVGIAIAVFLINRLQWRLQAQTTEQSRRKQEREEAKRAENLREEVRENVDAFYRSVEPEARADAFERLLEPLLNLKRDTAPEQRTRIADFVKFTRRLRDNTFAGNDRANAHLIGDWREQANELLELIGTSKLDWKSSGGDRRR